MHHVFSATFRCATCGEEAATVSLVPPGLPMPWRAPRPHEPPEARSWGADRWRLGIEGGPHPMMVFPARDPLTVAAALDRVDAEALAAVDTEYANFRCPVCRAPYCEDHWTDVIPEQDEGFYDATYATCPEGHRVMIDD